MNFDALKLPPSYDIVRDRRRLLGRMPPGKVTRRPCPLKIEAMANGVPVVVLTPLRVSLLGAQSQQMQAKCAWVTWRWGSHEALRRTLLEQQNEPNSRQLRDESAAMSLRQAFELFLKSD